MLSTIKTAHHQLADGYAIGMKTKVPTGKFEHLIICGMGGSALAGEMLKDYVKEEVQIDVVHDYFLPAGIVREHSLVLAFSYSGTTEETISCLNDARKKDIPIVVICNDGAMKEIALENHLPYYELPKIDEPRCSIGYGLGILMAILEQVGVMRCLECSIDETATFIESQLDALETLGRTLASQIKGTVPIIYAGPSRSSLARVMKIHFNENAKTQSFCGEIPEMNHNEMAGYTNLIMKPTIIYLRSQFDYDRVRLRMDVMKELLEEKSIPNINIRLKGGSWLDETYYTLMLAYFASYFLAEEYGVDYSNLEIVKEFKKRIA